MSRMIKWLDNYWYHYKWHTIIVAFFLVIAMIITMQFVNRESYDTYIMYVGNQEIPATQYQDIVDSFRKISSDTDNNGTIAINFSRTAFISDPENELASVTNSVAAEFLSSLIVQPYYIYLIVPEAYEIYKGSGVFVDLREVAGDIPEEWFYDDSAILFDRTPFAQTNAGVDKISSQKLLLVLKNVPYSGSEAVKKAEQASFNNHLAIIKRILQGA